MKISWTVSLCSIVLSGIGDYVFVGAGAVVVQCVNVGAGSFIKAGEVYSG